MIETAREPHTVTAEEAAAIEFEAWEHAAGEWKPPTNKEWAESGANLLPYVRLAWMTLYKSKPELIEIIRNLDEQGSFEELFDGIETAIKFFNNFATVLNAARGRIVCASSVIELETAEAGHE